MIDQLLKEKIDSHVAGDMRCVLRYDYDTNEKLVEFEGGGTAWVPIYDCDEDGNPL